MGPLVSEATTQATTAQMLRWADPTVEFVKISIVMSRSIVNSLEQLNSLFDLDVMTGSVTMEEDSGKKLVNKLETTPDKPGCNSDLY